MRGSSHLKEEALDRTTWRNHFGGGFGPVVRQNTERMNEFLVRMWDEPSCLRIGYSEENPIKCKETGIPKNDKMFYL